MADLVDITATYAVIGEFDSRKRYLREVASSSLALVNGATWTIGAAQVNNGQPWCAWSWKLGGLAYSLKSTTVGGDTQTQTLADPAPVLKAVTP